MINIVFFFLFLLFIVLIQTNKKNFLIQLKTNKKNKNRKKKLFKEPNVSALFAIMKWWARLFDQVAGTLNRPIVCTRDSERI